MVTSRKLLVLAGLLLAVQLASAGRPLFGLHKGGGQKVDGAEVVSPPDPLLRPTRLTKRQPTPIAVCLLLKCRAERALLRAGLYSDGCPGTQTDNWRVWVAVDRA